MSQPNHNEQTPRPNAHIAGDPRLPIAPPSNRRENDVDQDFTAIAERVAKALEEIAFNLKQINKKLR